MGDDIAEGANIRRHGRSVFANALRTTRSTLLTGAGAALAVAWALEWLSA
jgi:hypothetical protein